MLTPPRSTAPFWSAAPDRILPVCPGWMPTPVACLLNSPETTLSRGRSDANGSRLLLSSMSAPEPLAHQFLGLMPLPMNRAAKRWGYTVAAPAGSPLKPDIDSSHGRAMVTPRPFSRVRRLIPLERGFVMLMVLPSETFPARPISFTWPKTFQIRNEVEVGIGCIDPGTAALS